MKQYCAAVVIALGLWATSASAQGTTVTAPTSLPIIQFGIPQNQTLAQARKEAHTKADTLDKMTPEQWHAGLTKFHQDMANISQMSPEEKQRLYPGVPASVLSHMGHAGVVQPAQMGNMEVPKESPADMLKKAQMMAHEDAVELDKTTDEEWAAQQKRSKYLVDSYQKMQDKHIPGIAQ